MKTNTDKHLEALIGKMMKESALEKASPDFTKNLMTAVSKTSVSKATVYKPLISIRSWFFIFGGIAALLVYLNNAAAVQVGKWSDYFNLASHAGALFKNMPAIRFSSITLYALILLTVLLIVQITFLKIYFNKRMEA